MKFEYRFPDIGEGITEGTLFKWFVKEGDLIKEGEPVAEVETDKVTADIPSAKTGIVQKLNFNIGDTINVGDVFIVIETEGGSAAGAEKAKTENVVEKENLDQKEEPRTVKSDKKIGDIPKEAEKKELIEKEEVLEEETAGVVGEVIASSREIPPSTEGQETAQGSIQPKKALATPVARQMAKDLGVDITTVAGTGPNGRVMKEDISKQPNRKPKLAKQLQLQRPGWMQVQIQAYMVVYSKKKEYH